MVNDFELYHYIPFDMGEVLYHPNRVHIKFDDAMIAYLNGLSDDIEMNGKVKEEIDNIKFLLYRINYNVNKYYGSKIKRKIDIHIHNCLVCYEISENLHCYLLSYGIGVFVLKEKCQISSDDLDCFSFHLYRQRKMTHKKILQNQRNSEMNELSCMRTFMELIWSSMININRESSACNEYKSNGFSYVLTLYLIHSDQIPLEETENANLYHLLHPQLLSNVNKNNLHKEDILDKICMTTEICHAVTLSNDLILSTSWSGVSLVGNIAYNDAAIENILNAEIEIQSKWFLFDCIADNIEQREYTLSELYDFQKYCAFYKIDLDHIVSAKISTSIKNGISAIVETSEILPLYYNVENKISKAIESKKQENELKKNKYNYISQLILLMLTFVSAFEAIHSVMVDGIMAYDMIIVLIMTIIFVIVAYFINKENELS